MMTFRLRHLFARGEKLLPAIAVATALAITAPVTLGAASAAEASPAQTVGMPDWQQAAGGKSSFEVASIRPSKPGTFTPPTFPLSAGASYGANTDTFIGDFPLEVYIEFAYKMRPTRDQVNAMLAPLPKWVGNESFTIHAKAAEPATKDQMRLMMQSLLAERFGLRLHFETQEVPVLVLTLEKAGRIGPNLHPHTDGPPCNRPASEFKAHGSADGGPDVFPSECDV